MRYGAVVVVTLTGILLGLAVPTMAPSTRARVVRAWSRALLAAVGIRLVVTARHQLTVAGPPGTLVVANHVSWLDGIVVFAVEPVGVLVKEEVRGWPVIGPLLRRIGARYIDRANLRQLPDTVADLAASLRSGESSLVFPEATTWCGVASGRFRPATFQAAIDADAMVTPVSIRYQLADGSPTTVPAFVGDEALWISMRRIVATCGLTVLVGVHEPIPAAGAERRELARTAESVITRDTPPRPVPTHCDTSHREHIGV